VEKPAAARVFADHGEGGARDRLRHAERIGHPLDEAGLAAAQVPVKRQGRPPGQATNQVAGDPPRLRRAS
jgi:hypothetical protein